MIQQTLKQSKFKKGDKVKFVDKFYANDKIFEVKEKPVWDKKFAGSWTGIPCYRYDVEEVDGENSYYGIAEDNLELAEARSEEPETASEASLGCIPALENLDIIKTKNGHFYQLFKSMKGFCPLDENDFFLDKACFDDEGRYNNYMEGIPKYDIIKIYRGVVAANRFFDAPESTRDYYEIWSRPEPYVIPLFAVKQAIHEYIGFEVEDIKMEDGMFVIDGALVSPTVREVLEEELKKDAAEAIKENKDTVWLSEKKWAY